MKLITIWNKNDNLTFIQPCDDFIISIGILLISNKYFKNSLRHWELSSPSPCLSEVLWTLLTEDPQTNFEVFVHLFTFLKVSEDINIPRLSTRKKVLRVIFCESFLVYSICETNYLSCDKDDDCTVDTVNVIAFVQNKEGKVNFILWNSLSIIR